MQSLNRTVGMANVRAIHFKRFARALQLAVDRHWHIGEGHMEPKHCVEWLIIANSPTRPSSWKPVRRSAR